MSVKKQFLKSKPQCKVKFRLSRGEIGSADAVSLVGSFNDWNHAATPMSELKSGDFTATLYLDLDQTYEFRYLIDDAVWVSDVNADGLVPAPYPEAHNSVVNTAPVS